MRSPVMLLLDVDGVVNVPRLGVPPFEWSMVRLRAPSGESWPASPSPRVRWFLRAIDDADWLIPCWLTTWGHDATAWNVWASTRRSWAVLPRPTQPPRGRDRECIPAQRAGHPDWKVGAARSVFRRWPGRRVVWIEDGFSEEARTWAAHAGPRLVLVDTTPHQILQAVGHERSHTGHQTLSQAAYDLLYCWDEETPAEQQAAVDAFLAQLRTAVAAPVRRLAHPRHHPTWEGANLPSSDDLQRQGQALRSPIASWPRPALTPAERRERRWAISPPSILEPEEGEP